MMSNAHVPYLMVRATYSLWLALMALLGMSVIGIYGIDNFYPLVLILIPFMTVVATSLL